MRLQINNVQDIHNAQNLLLLNQNKLYQDKTVPTDFFTFLIDIFSYILLTISRIIYIFTLILNFIIVKIPLLYKNIKFIFFQKGHKSRIISLNLATLNAVVLIVAYILISRLYNSAQNINYLVSTHHPPLLISQADGYLKQDIQVELLSDITKLVEQDQKSTQKGYFVYKVRSGDTIYTIASKYGVSTTTIISANKLTNPNFLKIGQSLKIPSQNGILYTVKSNETLASIAKKYKISTTKLAEANNLTTKDTIKKGQILLIPGVKPKLPTYATKKTTSSSSTPKYISGSYFSGASGSCSFALKYVGYGLQNYKVKPAVKYVKFIRYNPVAGSFRLGSGFAGYRWGTYYWHSGIDYIANYGTPIIAVADGVVNRTGYQSGGYGYYIKIYHPQVGMYTLYGHLSRYASGIHTGQKVKAGQVIGYVGRSGLAYGNHLHFEVIDRNRLRYNAVCFK